MKNFPNTDYALNKFSDGIVYRFNGQHPVTVTLADYLAENPEKTEQDFEKLKVLSDTIYFEQDRAENRQTKKNITIHGIDDSRDFGDIPLDEQYIETQDMRYAANSISHLIDSDILTETQRRRFILHIIKGLSMRHIAELEGTSHVAIIKSIHLSIEKAKKYFSG